MASERREGRKQAVEHSRARRVVDAGVATFRLVRELTERERQYLLAEMVQVKGLLPLLMKPRNHQPWTPADRTELRAHMRRLSHISPYIAVLALPGSFVMLPALAWWLDRRRNRQTVAVLPNRRR